MEKFIKYGDRIAIINTGENRASLMIEDPQLPVALADSINKNGDLDVTEVSAYEGKFFIRIVHDLPLSELVNVICESITEVYDTDATVCNART